MGIFNSRYLLIAGLLVHLLYMTSLGTGIINEFFYDSSHFQKGQASDFFVFYNASRLLLKQKSIYGSQDADTPHMYGRYSYIPTFVFLTAWIGFFKPYASYILWIVLIETSLIASIILSLKWKKKHGFQISDNFLVFLWLIPSPYYLELFMGQNTFLFAFLLFVFLLSQDLFRGRWIGFISFSLSIISKIASIIYIPLFFRKKQYAIILAPLVFTAVTSAFYFTVMDTARVTIQGSSSYVSENIKTGKSIYKMPMAAKADKTDETVHIKSPVNFSVRLPRGIYITLNHILKKPQSLYYPQVPGFSSLFYNITGSIDLFRLSAIIMWIAVYSLLMFRPGDYILDFSLLIMLFFITFTFIWEHHYTLLIPFMVLIIIREPSVRLPMVAAYLLVSAPTPFMLYNPALLGWISMEHNLIKGLFYYLPKSSAVIIGFSALLYLKFSKIRNLHEETA